MNSSHQLYILGCVHLCIIWIIVLANVCVFRCYDYYAGDCVHMGGTLLNGAYTQTLSGPF